MGTGSLYRNITFTCGSVSYSTFACGAKNGGNWEGGVVEGCRKERENQLP